MSRRVLKWPVPVDDQDHPIGWGPVALVDSTNPRLVHVWTIEESESVNPWRAARVYGTGQPVVGADEHLGSVNINGLEWHVFAALRADRNRPLTTTEADEAIAAQRDAEPLDERPDYCELDDEERAAYVARRGRR